MRGYFVTEIGSLNRVIHLWEYESLSDRAQRRESLYQDAEWVREFIPYGLPMLLSQRNELWTPGVDMPPMEKVVKTCESSIGNRTRSIVFVESDEMISNRSGGELLTTLCGLTTPGRHARLEAFTDMKSLQERLEALSVTSASIQILQPCDFSPLR